MVNREELWDKAIDEARNRWTAGRLDAGGRHCAVGILGYVKWGAEFDEESRDRYAQVADDPELGQMLRDLTATISEQCPDLIEKLEMAEAEMAEFFYRANHLPFRFGLSPWHVVTSYNDQKALDGEDVALMMEKARNR